MTALRPEKLLRELDDLWVSLGKEDTGESGVLRACSMTFLVATEGLEDEVGETLAHLMRDHPSRAVVVRCVDGEAPRLEARVLAQCWMPFGRRQQICCEQIEITASRASLDGVAPLVRGLVVPDLPVVLWCRGAGLLDLGGLRPLRDVADKLVVDSQAVADPVAQFRRIAATIHGGRLLGDLAWTRLTRWRETIAQVFDAPGSIEGLSRIDSARIEYQGEYVPLSAFYLAAWLQHSLGRAPRYEFVAAAGGQRARLHQVALQGKDIEITVTVSADRAVRIRAGGRDTNTVFPRRSEYELLREELSLLGRDPVYDAIVQIVPELTGRFPR